MGTPEGHFTMSDGSLVRYSDGATIRKNYSLTFATIDTGLQFRATLRAGSHTVSGVRRFDMRACRFLLQREGVTQ